MKQITPSQSGRSLWCGLISIVCCVAITGQSANAQESKESESSQPSKASQVMEKISDLIEEGDWEQAKTHMTESAWDGWCERLVVKCHSMAKMEMNLGVEIPGFEESQDEIEEVFKEYKLDEIEITNSILEIRGNASRGDSGETDEERETRERQHQQILATLDADGKRIEIVGELWDARSTSPFDVTFFGGKVEMEEAGEESDVESCFLTITPTVASDESEGSGISFKVMAPPVVINMVKNDGVWMFDGLNMERTAEESKAFQPEIPGSGGYEDF